MNTTNDYRQTVALKSMDYLSQISPVEEAVYYDASRIQIGQWVMHYYGEEKKYSNTWNIWIMETLPFFDKEKAMEAIKTVINRHDLLRTTLVFEDGKPMQWIHPLEYFEDAIQFYSLEMSSQEAMTHLGKEAYCRPFNPIKGPLFYVKIVETHDDTVFIFNLDHSITDDMSNAILKKEMFEVYRAYLQNQPNPLPPLRVQYRDFVYWNKKLIADKITDQFLKYWHRFTDKQLPETNLSIFFGKKPIKESYQTVMQQQIRNFMKPMPEAYEALIYGNLAKLEFMESDGYEFVVNNEIYKGLKKKALEHGTSMFNVLSFGFHLMVYRISNCNDSMLGVNMPMRNNEDLINMVGFLINTVLIRNQIVPSATFDQNLKRIIEDNLETTELAFYPMETLLKDLDFPFPEISTIFINMINRDESDKRRIKKMEPRHLNREIWMTYFDLDFHIVEQKNGIEMVCEYNKSIFSKLQIEQIHAALIEVLAMIAFQGEVEVAEAFASKKLS